MWFVLRKNENAVAVTNQPAGVPIEKIRAQAGDGVEVIEVSEADANLIMAKLIDHDIKIDSQANVIEQRKRPTGVSYREHRSAAYPAIGDQLDAIWKAIAGGDMTEAEKMMEKIQSVKLAHPKPQ